MIKHFPFHKHKYALKAAKAALAANEQGKFWEFHHGLLQNYRSINDAMIQNLAKALGLDMEKFATDMRSPSIHRLIRRDIEDGRQAGVRGTPTIFINGKKLKSRRRELFIQSIEMELGKTK